MIDDDAPVTLTLTARNLRILIHTFGWAVSNSEADEEYGVGGEYKDRLWGIYHDMLSQSQKAHEQ